MSDYITTSRKNNPLYEYMGKVIIDAEILQDNMEVVSQIFHQAFPINIEYQPWNHAYVFILIGNKSLKKQTPGYKNIPTYKALFTKDRFIGFELEHE